MKKHLLLLLWAFCFASHRAQQICPVQNLAFRSGEILNFKVVYNWGFIWLESAEASFRVEPTQYNKKNCYLLTGEGSTYPKHDWFFKVRDKFESIVDSSTFRPLKFSAEINEGSKHDRHTYLFDHHRKKSYTIIRRGNTPVTLDTVALNVCSIDVLTAIYFARNIDYSKCAPNDTIGISVLMDGKLFPLYVRYIGRETYKSQLGTYRCIKFRPLLVEGSIFKKGENMTVWVSDDENKIPLYVETSIIVGSIKVSLSSCEGLRHPEKARIGK